MEDKYGPIKFEWDEKVLKAWNETPLKCKKLMENLNISESDAIESL